MDRRSGHSDIYASIFGPPVADIKIDGDDGLLSVPFTQAVSMTISIEPGNQSGVAHDWWVLGRRNATSYFSRTLGGWMPGVKRFWGGALVELDSHVVYNGTIPVGSYEFAFAVDIKDNIYQGTFFDVVHITSY